MISTSKSRLAGELDWSRRQFIFHAVDIDGNPIKDYICDDVSIDEKRSTEATLILRGKFNDGIPLLGLATRFELYILSFKYLNSDLRDNYHIGNTAILYNGGPIRHIWGHYFMYDPDRYIPN